MSDWTLSKNKPNLRPEDGRQMAEDREKNAKQTQSVTTEDRKPKAEDREKNAKQSQI